MRFDEFSAFDAELNRTARNLPRRGFLLSSFLGLAFLLVFAAGCAPPASTSGGNQSASGPSAANDLPEIDDETIRERINGAYLRDVPEETGSAEPINWGFDEQEPKEISVVEKQIDGKRATIVLDVKTRSAPNMRNPRALAGQISTEWELKTGWALRRWEIVETKNVSMKYKNLPKPPAAANSNR